MSILNKLKKINAQAEACLFKSHPLTNCDGETRLRYLSGLAIGLATNREVKEAEKVVFVQLADSLAVNEQDATEILTERGNVDETDINRIFGSIKSGNWLNYYMLDLAWLIVADEDIESGEIEIIGEICSLTGFERKIADLLISFAMANKHKAAETIFSIINNEIVKNTDVADLLGKASRIDFSANSKSIFGVTSGSFKITKRHNERSLLPVMIGFDSNEFFITGPIKIKWLVELGEKFKANKPVARFLYHRKCGYWSNKRDEYRYDEECDGYEDVYADFDGFMLERFVEDGSEITWETQHFKRSDGSPVFFNDSNAQPIGRAYCNKQ